MRFTRSSKSPAPQSPKRGVNIPNEIYPLILKYLSLSDLANSIRVSKDFYLIGIPLLYGEIKISSNKELNPGLIKRHKLTPFPSGLQLRVYNRSNGEDVRNGWFGPKYELWKQREKEERNKEAEETMLGTGYIEGKETKWLSRIIRRPVKYSSFTIRQLHSTPLTFEYTTHLILRTYHFLGECRQYRSMIMPNLVTLSMPSEVEGSYQSWFCHNGSPSGHNGECNEMINCVCPLITHLRPRRIILGNENTDPTINLKRSNVWPPLPTLARNGLKEVIIHATSYGMVDIGPLHESYTMKGVRIKPPPPIKFEKITFVLYRKEFEGVIADDGEWRWKEGGSVKKKIDWPLDLLWRRFVMALEGDPGVLEIVGMEEMDEDWSNEEFEYWDMELMRVEMKKYLVDSGISIEDAERRVDNVKFTRKAEYELGWK